jgi:hypothetical protein
VVAGLEIEVVEGARGSSPHDVVVVVMGSILVAAEGICLYLRPDHEEVVVDKLQVVARFEVVAPLVLLVVENVRICIEARR